MKYLDSARMTFLPPQKVFGEQKEAQVQDGCDHKGRRHTFSKSEWRCECGAKL